MLQGPTDVAEIQASARALGLVPEGLPEPEACEVWAEHWPALRVFGAMATQWVYRPDGRREGLNYAVLPIVEQRLRIRPRQSRALFEYLQALEAEALKWFRAQE